MNKSIGNDPSNDQENPPPEVAATAIPAEPIVKSKPAVQAALDSLFLTEEDLKNEAVARMVLNRMTLLENENKNLNVVKENFHLADKERAVALKELGLIKNQNMINNFSFASGGALVSLGGMIYSTNSSWGTIVALVGICLIAIPLSKRKGE